MSAKQKTLVVYRVEGEDGTGPWFHKDYCAHVGQYVDFYRDMYTPFEESWSKKVSMTMGDDFRCAMKSLDDIVRWFAIVAAELIECGLKLVKYEVTAYMIGTQQVIFKPESVVTKEILSLEEIFSKTVA